MKKCYFLLFLSIIVFLNFSCRKTNITPAYLLLSVEDFEDCIDVSNFHDKGYGQEELDIIKHQQFRDVHVTLNGKVLGYWPLPCTIPLLPEYSSLDNIEIIPCVRVPNTTLTTIQYRFLRSERRFLEMEKEGKYTFSDFKPDLKFVYWEGVEFPVLETFTQSTRFVAIKDSIYPATMEIVQDEEGKHMGRIALENTQKYFEVGTAHFNLAGGGVRHFWEIYYKCDDGEMTTYLRFQNTSMGNYSRDLIVCPPTNGSWKKLYIDITDIVSEAASYSANQVSASVSLSIRGLRTSESKNAYFYFGNMKLISMRAPY